jgi:hypothetical protein
VMVLARMASRVPSMARPRVTRMIAAKPTLTLAAVVIRAQVARDGGPGQSWGHDPGVSPAWGQSGPDGQT